MRAKSLAGERRDQNSPSDPFDYATSTPRSSAPTSFSPPHLPLSSLAFPFSFAPSP